jgi:hypothetical protein
MTSKTKKEPQRIVFAPGCALMLYKPELAAKLHSFLTEHIGAMDLLLTCCRHDPQVEKNTTVINVCPGCDKRFGNDYEDVSTISLWEILAECDSYPFPDYRGRKMSIQDACPTRDKESVHTAIRRILQKMNIVLVEPRKTRTKSICCGDSFYGLIPVDEMKELMGKRTAEMPQEEVVVYCVSCIKAVFIGGKSPRYLVDLLCADDTVEKTLEPDKWHKELDAYISLH